MDKKIRVAINGFGRIGRAFLKLSWEREDLEVIAVNDLGTIDSLSYLLKYDTVYGKWNHDIKTEKGGDGQDSFIVIDGKKIKYLQEKD